MATTVVQNLYQIYKIPASFITANDCNVEQYDIDRGLKEGNVVSVGDNIVFQQIRYLHNDFSSHEVLFHKIQRLRDCVREAKKKGKYGKARALTRYITQSLFVKDIINVYVDKTKKDWDKIRVKGFTFNGIHYTYLCSGAGQIRRNTASFINTEIREQIVKILNCGLDEKTTEYIPAKYSAYFALAFSSVLWVRAPRVCVIKDFTRTLKDQNVDFIVRNHEKGQESTIEHRIMDLELNCADGQGLIDPQFATLWGEDMHLPFTPCSFVLRSCFIKGNVVSFDFKEYARQHNITTIRDKWGREYNIDEIDVLLSESQFKTSKFYSSWQEYVGYMERGRISWGVSRYNKHVDDEVTDVNYQYIQALTLSKEDIEELIKPTAHWISQVCSGDLLSSLLYMFGTKSDDPTYQAMYGMAQTNEMKAVVKNIDFLQDSHIQRKIYKNITETINRAKLGKIWVRGNYQFMISDPVAQCQSALGLEPTGLLKADEVYSNFWRAKKVTKVDLCRSPMIDMHEHNPCSVVNNNTEADYWYQYLNSGIIYNTYDTSCFRHSDSDYDGDIVLSTDNEYFIKGSHKEQNIITYDKGATPVQKLTIQNITNAVKKGFGTGVGGFSNCATVMYAMAAIFNKPEQKEQHDAILTRIKLLREIVGDEIDRIKGAAKPSLPSDWKKYQNIEPSDTEEERKEKFKHNAMVISKKPYFFRYLYPELNKLFKEFEAAYNRVSLNLFGIKFKKLLKKEDKTPEETNLVRKYQKYSPLITSNCTMNQLCRAFESIDFDIKFSKEAPTSLLPTYEADYAPTFSQEKLVFVKSLYKRYLNKQSFQKVLLLYEDMESTLLTEEQWYNFKNNIITNIYNDLQCELQESKIEVPEFLFYCSRIAPQYANFNWGFAWDVLEDNILSYIPQGHSYFPVHVHDNDNDEKGVYYRGEKFTLKEITDVNELLIDHLIDILFSKSNNQTLNQTKKGVI